MKPFIGLDIGGTKCAVLLARVARGIEIVDKIRFDTHTERGPAYALDTLFASIGEMLARHGLAPEDTAAIGVSCGGPLDSRRGVVLSPPNLPGWENIPLTQMLTERFGVPAFLQNDANACALVEWKMGAGVGTRDMIFLTMGTGMGGGVIAEGQLLRGFTDMGGEIGHLRLAEDGPIGFGKAGSFEGFTSGGGIGRQAKERTRRLCAEGRPPKWTRDGVGDADITTKVMADYARAGDPDAVALFDFVGDMLGRGLALLVDAFNPERIVIGSIFARCEALLRPAMEAALAREAIPYSLQGLRVVPAQTGEALGDLASIMVALHAMGIDPLHEGDETDVRVLSHLDKLTKRYPALSGARGAVLAAYEALRRCFEGGGKLLIAGNGGSCADAQHIVGELMKGFWLTRPLPEEQQRALDAAVGEHAPLQGALPAIALTDHAALSSAFANDVNPRFAYAQQVLGYGRPGDVFLGISTSGNAANVLAAARVAKARGLTVIGLTGGDGGKLAAASDAAVVVPGNTPADVQELHLPVYHTLCAMLETKFFGA